MKYFVCDNMDECGNGDTIQEALDDYGEVCGNEPINNLIVYEGTPIKIKIVKVETVIKDTSRSKKC